MSRRRVLAGALAALAAMSTAASGRRGPAADRWLASIDRACVGVKAGALDTRAWRRRVLGVTLRVPLDRVLRAVDFDALAAALAPMVDAEPQRQVTLPLVADVDGFAFSAILSHMRARTAVVPHGHHNMVSMHVILEGAVHLRQYDRLRDEPAHLVVRPRADRACHGGDTAAISADRGNVHWFRALTDSYALILATYDLDPSAGPTGRDYVDPASGERRPDGSMRMPRLDEDEARRRYLAF